MKCTFMKHRELLEFFTYLPQSLKYKLLLLTKWKLDTLYDVPSIVIIIDFGVLLCINKINIGRNPNNESSIARHDKSKIILSFCSSLLNSASSLIDTESPRKDCSKNVSQNCFDIFETLSFSRDLIKSEIPLGIFNCKITLVRMSDLFS